MKRLKSLTALFPLGTSPSSRKHHTVTTASQAKRFEHYIDGYTYRKLASHHQAMSAIEGFYREFAGQDACSEDVLNYVQQWNGGRSLRSIRDEIAQCPEAQRWG
ncbi:MAG: hypothetical protein NW224_13120 [Leptolyngbyaceae cyanobacterium bins.302]|nr:hypothetical protein [Leptolyngbyaceae cyanobacterium bins.302]